MECREFVKRVNHQPYTVWIRFKLNDGELVGTLHQTNERDTAYSRYVNIDVPGNGRYTVDIVEQVTDVGSCVDDSGTYDAT